MREPLPLGLLPGGIDAGVKSLLRAEPGAGSCGTLNFLGRRAFDVQQARRHGPHEPSDRLAGVAPVNVPGAGLDV